MVSMDSFSHVLPSDAGLKTFPNNNASSYSTPLSRPYNLKGNWEIGLRNVTYSGCVNTFHNDIIKVGQMYSTPEMCKKADKPLLFKLPSGKTTKDLIKEINSRLKGLIEVKLDGNGKYCSWKMTDKNFCVGISKELRGRFKLWSDVITAYDHTPNNFFEFPKGHHTQVFGGEENLFLVLLPLKYEHTKWIVKDANENIAIETLIRRFNDQVKGLEIVYTEKDNKFVIKKSCRSDDSKQCYETIHLLSPGLLMALGLRRGGLFKGSEDSKFYGHNFARHFTEEWSVSEYSLNDMANASEYVDSIINLKAQAFGDRESAIKYLNGL